MKTLSVCLLAAGASAVLGKDVSFEPTESSGHFVEQFTDDWDTRWSASEATKESTGGDEVFSYTGKWAVEEPTVYPGIAGDNGLVAKSAAHHHAISAPFKSSFDPKDGLVVQYEVKLQKGLECGGAYIKLLSESPEGIQAKELSDKTPYTVMFGPDRCGTTNKVHFIFRHKNPITGEYGEKHMTAPPGPKSDKLSSLYTLIIRPDQSYEIKINDETSKRGSLLADFEPHVNPPAEIDDPNDKKPDTWVDEPKIVDPEAKKPEDWDEDAPFEIEDADAKMPEGWLPDEPANIADPDAQKPEEWSDEDDGDWIAPAIPNPKCADAPGCGKWVRPKKTNPDYKGKWTAPFIDNPSYEGIWAPKRIPNPDFFEDNEPHKLNPVAGVAFEWWTMQSDILVDNVYIGKDEKDAHAFASKTWAVKRPIEEALEKADKPKPYDDSAEGAKSFKDDPVNFAKRHLEEFVEAARENPIEAIKELPKTATVILGSFITFIGLLGALMSLLAPKPEVVKQKTKAAAKKVEDAATEVKESTKATAIAAKDEVKKRTAAVQAKAKNATVEDE